MQYILLFFLWFYVNVSEAKSWPVVIESETKYALTVEIGFNVIQNIYSADGTLHYQLRCHNHEYEYDESFNYSGDFNCKLKPMNNPKERYEMLLSYTDHPTADWETRGLFMAEDLSDGCVDDRWWGRQRIFNLRGLVLILEITNEKFFFINVKKDWVPQFKSFDFKVVIKIDKNADNSLHAVANKEKCKR